MNAINFIKKPLAASILLIASGTPLSALAATSTVCASGCDYTTVQAALDAAADGDTISLEDPVHTEAGISWAEQVGATNVTIQGKGRDETVLQAAPTPGTNGRIFSVDLAKTATLRDMTVKNGGGLGEPSLGVPAGGALLCAFSTLNLENVRVVDNEAVVGGGVFLYACDGSVFDNVVIENNASVGNGGGLYAFISGETTISNSVIRGNESLVGRGGGIKLRSPGVRVVLQETRILDNVAADNGGGIDADFGASIDATHSTIAGNTGLFGGGININSVGNFASIRLASSTISGNRALVGGAGMNIDSFDSGSTIAQLFDVTVSGNVANEYGGGVTTFATNFGYSLALITDSTIAENDGGFGADSLVNWSIEGTAETVFRGSIIAGSGNDNCGRIGPNLANSSLFDEGYNTVSDGSCHPVNPPEASTVVNADAKLGPLQDNGGPTQTHGFRFADSDAVDRRDDFECGQGDPFLGPDVDQRGIARPQGPACDSGAFEMTPIDAIASQLDLIAGLLADGVLGEGLANSLTVKLEHSATKLANGELQAAVGSLGAYINQLSALIDEGLFDADLGASSIATAQWSIDNA